MHRVRLRRVRNVACFARAMRLGQFAPASELELLWYAKHFAEWFAKHFAE